MVLPRYPNDDLEDPSCVLNYSRNAQHLSMEFDEHIMVMKSKYPYVSSTEYIEFIFCDMGIHLEKERNSICIEAFTFNSIRHSSNLVQFYTGMPDANEFLNINNGLEPLIFEGYGHWDRSEKKGFINHTMMVFMKLKLNMTDKELAERFLTEPYVVNMTLRKWLPVLYKTVYKTYEEVYTTMSVGETHQYTKIFDFVEICCEPSDNTRPLRSGEILDTKKAVLGVRADGHVFFASNFYSIHRPDPICFQRSGLDRVLTNSDVVQTKLTCRPTISSFGVVCRNVTPAGLNNLQNAKERIHKFRILQETPLEYVDLLQYIFPICAALTNINDDIDFDDDY